MPVTHSGPPPRGCSRSRPRWTRPPTTSRTSTRPASSAAGPPSRTCSTTSSRRRRPRRRARRSASAPASPACRRSSSRARCSDGQPARRGDQGEGFFEVTPPRRHEGLHPGRQLHDQRPGHAHDRRAATPVSPRITIPANAKRHHRSARPASITATVDGKMHEARPARLATSRTPTASTSAGDSLYDGRGRNSGAARAGRPPGQSGAGSIRQGALEGSNVNAVDEMVGMVTTQRAYEAVSKVITRLRRDARPWPTS